MPHVSSKLLTTKIRKDIDGQLIKVVAKHTNVVCSELLTSTERIMLAKRLAIILMLDQGLSYYRIHKILAVSVSTIKRLHGAQLSGYFNALRVVHQTKRKREEFLTFLETVLQMGLSPRGRGRWRKLFRDSAKQS
jgi:uncharacterized protein YerC